MAGGIAAKSNTLVTAARSAITPALLALEQINQSGNPTADTRVADADAKVAAAITALQALV